MKSNEGKVIIAGAGPGNVELITVKLQHVLGLADVILYDRLVNEAILSWCKKDALKFSVGKSGKVDAKDNFAQDEIHILMIKYAQAGKTVLRLKGGDPFVFGRGSEECEALVNNGIMYEMIPGISSAIAGPLYAGIPISHRGLSRSVAIATGHLMKGETSENIIIPKADTIIYLMAIKNLSIIVNKFFEQNYAKDTPCVLIQEACTCKQKTYLTTLQSVCQVRDDNNVKPPALFVVGEVTKLRENLAWVEKQPLFGKTLLVTRTQSQASIMSQRLSELGADVVEYPVIEISRDSKAKDILYQKSYIDKFTDIILTSANGIEIFFETLFECGLDARSLAGKNIITIGKMSAARLLDYGIKADIIPDYYQAEGILEKLDKELKGRNLLLVRAKNARTLLIDEIEERGGTVSELVLYEATQPKDTLILDENLILDGICFTSASTVNNFCKINLNNKDTKVFTIGAITAKSAEDHGFTNIYISDEATIDSVIAKIVEVYRL